MRKNLLGPLAGVFALFFSLRLCCVLPPLLAAAGLGATGFLRFYSAHRWIFAAAAALFLLLAFVGGVLRDGRTTHRLAFLCVTLFVSVLIFWPAPPQWEGWALAALSVLLIAATVVLMVRDRPKAAPCLPEGTRLLLQVRGLT